MSEPQRKPWELWTDEKGYALMWMKVGDCNICRAEIFAAVPQTVLVTVSHPFFCEMCRKAILKIIRPDLKEETKT